MKATPPVPPKTRADCILAAKLDPLAADDLAHRLDNGLSLAAAVRWLTQEHGITVAESSVSRWAAKRRRVKAERSFAALREELELDREQVFDLCERDAVAIEKLFEANVLLAARALYAAQRSGDEAKVLQATRVFASVVGAVTRARHCAVTIHDGLEKAIARAEADVLHNELAIQRNDHRRQRAEITRARFDFNGPELAKTHFDELRKLNSDHSLSQRQRIDRAIQVIFRSAEKAGRSDPRPEEAAVPPDDSLSQSP